VPIIVVKHPISFVASMVRVNSEYNEMEVMKQPVLVEKYLKEERESFTRPPSSIVEASARLWRVAHKVIFQMAKCYSDWIIVRQEDLSLEPIETFCTLYKKNRLPWSNRIEKRIKKMTGSKNTINGRAGHRYDLRRNSRAILKARFASLSPSEKKVVYNLTGDIASYLYEDKYWDF
jgi:hypothetical protein